jgi:NitT/TauT family transport system substrate-binding protein
VGFSTGFKRLMANLGLGLILVSLAGCGEPEPILNVGTNPWPGYEGMYLAKQLGYYNNTSIRLHNFGSAQEAMRAFRNGALDAVAVTLDEALQLAENEQQPRVILVFDVSRGADVLLARPTIASLADLRGKRLGVETSALGAYMLTRILQKANIKPTELTVVSITLDKHEEAFKTGQVDAVITFDPVRAKLMAAGARELFSSRSLPGEIVDVLVVRASALRSHQQGLQKLVDGHFLALQTLRRDPAAAALRLAPRGDGSADALRASWQLMELPDRPLNQRMLGQGEGSLLAALRGLENVMRQYGLLRSAVDTRDLLDDRFVRAGQS